ncbi:type IV toxin-antitoxin system AbiEi family antitoxin domain-containing protein [Rhodococcus koreensis]
MSGDDRLLTVADLAQGQWGMFTSAQAADMGVSAQYLKRLADRFLITRLRHGVYRVAGAPLDPRDPLRAQWLALEPARSAAERIAGADPVGVVSHRSAAHLRELGDMDADTYEFTVTKRRNTRSLDVRFHVEAVERSDWTLVDGLPVTTPTKTIVDLASSRTDGGHLAGVVWDALRTQQVSREPLAEALREFAHLYGAPIGDGDALVEQLIAQASAAQLGPPVPTPDEIGRLQTAARQISSSTQVAAVQDFSASDQARDVQRVLRDPAFTEALRQLRRKGII